jgi:hypothetical protein
MNINYFIKWCITVLFIGYTSLMVWTFYKLPTVEFINAVLNYLHWR